MRRARSQLSKLTQQQGGNFGGVNPAQNPYGVGSEVDEIQRRLDALQYQQGNTHFAGGNFHDPMANHGFPQPMPSSGYHQPAPQSGFHQPIADPYAAQNMAMHNQQNHMENQYSAPRGQSASNQQLDTIKSALEQMSSKLHSINQANSNGNTQQNSAVQQSELLQQHYNHINNELQALKASIAGISSGGISDKGLEVIQETLSANYRAIMQQLEGSNNNQIDNSVFSSALEASHKELSQQIIDIKQSIDASLNNPNHYAKTLEVSHDDITKRLDDMHNALQTSIAAPDRYMGEIENNHSQVLHQISQLQHVVENIETNTPEGTTTDLSSVEMRLEEITRAVVALSLDDGSVNNLERIEARVSDIAKTLDSNNKVTSTFGNDGFERLEEKLSDIANLMNNNAPGFNGVEAQINILSEKLENFTSVSASAPLSNDENNALLKRMDELVEQIGNSQQSASNDEITQQLGQISTAIDKLSVPSSASGDNGSTNEVIIQQLEQIAGAIDQLSHPAEQYTSENQLASIEQQLSEISNHLSNNSLGFAAADGGISFDPITSRLSGIEEQISSSRDITIELATKAAEDAVKMSVQAMPQMAGGSSEMNAGAMGSMSELLAQLNQHVETSNSTNIEAFGAVTQTLDLMVQRLGNIEAGLAGYGSSATTPQQTDANASQPAPVQTLVNEEASKPAEFEDSLSPSSEVEQPAEIPQEDVREVRNPAADLVKAARLSAAREEASAPVVSQAPSLEMEPIANEAPIELQQEEQPAVGSIQAAVEQVATAAQEPVLPEVPTPDMAIDSLPEMREPQDNTSGPEVALEPGTGGPDLAALVRQANDRRKNNKGTDIESSGTDFIAAARRAAQAAAQEAGAVEEEIEEKKSKSLFASLPELFAKRKKVIIMAAAAALFAVIAIPLASQFMGGQSEEIAAVESSVVIEQTTDEQTQQASTIPTQSSVTQVEQTVDTTTPVASAPVAQQSDVPVLEPQETLEETSQQVNLASVDLNENPVPTTFISTEGLDFAPVALKEAVEKGEPAAIFEIGRLYTNGIGTEKDLLKAAEWYERSAKMGFAPAQYIIGNFNEKGLGVDKNLPAAAEWYKQAAKGGNIIAMHNLAVLTATPNALTANPDMDEAFKWFSNAADYGVRDSQVNAGIFHTKGFGTEVNLVEAYKWFAIAAKAGDKDAGNKRDVIGNAIQPDQLEIAKALVKDWVPLEVVQAANEVPVNDAWKPAQAVASSGFKVDRNVIAQTQKLLTKVGFNAGVADGLMGQKTRNAIAAFQQKSGLPVNGRIDSEFLKALKAVAI